MQIIDCKLFKFLGFRKNEIAFKFSSIFVLRCRRAGKVVARNTNAGCN